MIGGKRRYDEIDESSYIRDGYFTILVEAADKPKAACEAIIDVQLIGDEGISEEEEFVVTNFPTQFTRGQKYMFIMNESKYILYKQIKNVTGVLVRGDMMVVQAGWNIDKITVINNKTEQQFVIPVFTNIKSERMYTFLVDDVSLPQLDSRATERQGDLDEMGDLYKLTEEKLPGGPPLVTKLPHEETFSFCYELKIGIKLKELELDPEIREHLTCEFKK